MRVQVVCPDCRRSYQVDGDSLGSRARCAGCGSRFTLAAAADETERADPARTPPGGARPPQQLRRFQVLEQVGEGAFGAVYRAYDQKLDRHVALKVARRGSMSSEEESRQFLREARAVARLRHPRIVTVFDADQVDGSCFIVSDFIDGRTLRAWLEDADEPVPLREKIRLVCDIASALSYAHQHDVVHRDVKPENVMLDEDGRANLVDFGVARSRDPELLAEHAHARLGTPVYMSPEQHAGHSHDADQRSDLWSLGVVLYEMLTGAQPFEGGNLMQLSYAIQKTEPVPPRQRNPEVSRDLETIIRKCLAKDPRDRYASCDVLLEELQRYLRNEPILARRAGVAERLWRWSCRKPIVASLAAAALLAAAVGLGVSGHFAARARQNAMTAKTAREQASLIARREKEQRALVALKDAEARAQQAEAELQRIEADRQRAKTRQAEERAVQLASQAEQKSNLAALEQRRRYAADMRLAQNHLTAGDADRARQILASYQDSSMRRFEWGFLAQRVQRAVPLFETDQVPARHVAVAPNGRWIAHAAGRILEVTDRETGTLVARFDEHVGDITGLAFSPDGTLASAANGWCGEGNRKRGFAEVMVWNVAEQDRLHHVTLDPGRLNDLVFSHDGSRLALAAGGITFSDGSRSTGAVVIWDVATWETTLEHAVVPDGGSCRCLAFSPDDTLIAAGGRYWDPEKKVGRPILSVIRSTDGTVQHRFPGHLVPVVGVAFRLNGSRLISCATGRMGEPGGSQHDYSELKEWDLAEQKEVAEAQFNGMTEGLLLNPRSGQPMTFGTDGVTQWALTRRGREFESEVLMRGRTRSVDVDPYGQMLVAGGAGVRLRNEGVAQFRRRWGAGQATRFLADYWDEETTLEALDEKQTQEAMDDTIRQALVPELQEVLEDRDIARLALSPDGERLAVFDTQGALAVWDTATGERLLERHVVSGDTLLFSRDGARLLIANPNTVCILDGAFLPQPPPPFARAQREEDRAIRFGELTLQLPADWKVRHDAQTEIVMEAQIPRKKPLEARLGVAPQVDLDAMLKQQSFAFFPQGRESATAGGNLTEGRYVIADIRGDLKVPWWDGSFARQKDVRMLVAVIQMPERTYKLEMKGPAADVERFRASFRSVFGGDAERETPYGAVSE